MKKKLTLFLLFGGLYLIFSSFLNLFSDALALFLAFLFPILLIVFICLISFKKLGWLEKVKENNRELSRLLSILGGYFYSVLFVGLIVQLVSYLGLNEEELKVYSDLADLLVVLVTLFVLAIWFVGFVFRLFKKES